MCQSMCIYIQEPWPESTANKYYNIIKIIMCKQSIVTLETIINSSATSTRLISVVCVYLMEWSLYTHARTHPQWFNIISLSYIYQKLRSYT